MRPRSRSVVALLGTVAGALALAAPGRASARDLHEQVAEAVPEHRPTHGWLAVSCTRQGRTEDAAREKTPCDI